MKKCDWSCFLLGLLLTTAVACRPITVPDNEESPNQTAIPANISEEQEVTAAQQTPPIPHATQTPTPPPLPTPAPTSSATARWNRFGSQSNGLEISAPSNWLNITGQLSTAATNNPLGLVALVLVNSERTGASFLAGKPITNGAFMTTLVSHLALPDEPTAGMLALLSTIPQPITTVEEGIMPQPFVVPSDDGSIQGAMIDVLGEPAGFVEDGANLRSRIVLLTMSEGEEPEDKTQVIFIFSAPVDQWEKFDDTFAQMANSIVIHDLEAGFIISDSDADFEGVLESQNLVSDALENGRNDLWTFNAANFRFATITLTPEDPGLDLKLTVINPSGQTVAVIDNGYTDDTEVATDILLTDPGNYVVQVSEFFNRSGRYSLSLVLTTDPLFLEGGRIRPGQSIHSELPANGQQLWLFDGVAGEVVSIVLTPDDRFDAILNLFGPDGNRLVALDEGFNGDAEVVANFVLPVTGEYTILVTSFAGNSGTYTLSLDKGEEETSNFYEAGDLAYGDTRRETLQPHEAHTWYFQGKAGDRVTIEVVPVTSILDLDVWLLDPNVKKLAAQDENLQGESERIEAQLPQDGEYVVLVRDFNGEPGVYEVTLNAMPVKRPTYVGMLSYGQTVTGDLPPGQMDLWLFDASEGDVIDIVVMPNSVDVDLLIAVQNPDGETVLTVDEGALGEGEQLLDFVVTSDGVWGIVVQEFFSVGGGYTLTADFAQ